MAKDYVGIKLFQLLHDENCRVNGNPHLGIAYDGREPRIRFSFQSSPRTTHLVIALPQFGHYIVSTPHSRGECVWCADAVKELRDEFLDFKG